MVTLGNLKRFIVEIYSSKGFYRNAAVYSFFTTILSIVACIAIYEIPQIPDNLSQYPLLAAIVSFLVCILNLYLWRKGQQGVVIDIATFIKAFVIYESFYYILLAFALITVPVLSKYSFLVFDWKFLLVNIGLTFVASYARVTIYEYLKHSKVST